jgi:hypothetical protein
MTTLNYILVFVGFGLWFYAGYNRGKSKVRIKERKYEGRQDPPPKPPKQVTNIEITIK